MSHTLRYASRSIKRKARLRCAEAVDASDSLWKAMEKRVGISGRPLLWVKGRQAIGENFVQKLAHYAALRGY